MKLKIKVDSDLCIGAASCVTIDPATFQLNAENKAEVLDHGQEINGPTYEREVEMTADEKDNLILFELLQDCRQPISKIASAVKLPQQTVTYRIKKFEREGNLSSCCKRNFCQSKKSDERD